MIADDPAERTLLGAILLDPAAYWVARSIVAPEHFVSGAGAVVFGAMGSVLDRGQPLDVATLAAELRRAEKLNTIGGAGALAALTDDVATTAHVEAHARMALGRGSAVHSATQFDDEGDLDETMLDDELVPYVAAWRRFRAETGFVPDLIEHRSYHPIYLYAGTLDRRGAFPDGTKAIIDLKSNQSEGWVALQLAAYSAFFESPRAYRRICVEAHKDGTYRMIEFRSADYTADFGRFLACVTVLRLQQAFGRLTNKQERKIA